MKIKLIIIITSLISVFAGLTIGFIYAKSTDVKKDIKKASYHYSPISQKQYFDDFFIDSGNCQNNYNPSIKGLIVNHHLLAGKFMAKAFCSVATTKPLTVVILSPNHFGSGQGAAIASLDDWQTPYGIVKADQTLAESLAKNSAVSIEETPFEKEHGIFNIISFVKKTLPNARVVAIIVKDNVTAEQKEKIIQTIGSNIANQVLVVTSLDFSHYLTSADADAADTQTLAVINNFDFASLKNLNPKNKPDNVDSKPILEILLKIMSLASAKNFNLISHSNSAKLINDANLTETTSYITGFFAQKNN